MKFALVLAFLALPTLSFGSMKMQNEYKKANPDKAATTNCKTCHTEGKKLNEFGEQYKKDMAAKK